MSKVLVDSAAWIDYFAGKKNSETLDPLIEENLICVNDLILAELLPSIRVRKAFELASMLKAVEKIPLTINWDEIVKMQVLNQKRGINKVGLPDLIIVQNVVMNNLDLYSPDRHFRLMRELFGFKLISV
jgi:predicted nucleic acid-binding protein